MLLGGNATARPDLVELSVSVSQHGRSITVADRLINRGAASAPASTAGYFLAHKEIGSRHVSRLRPHDVSRGTKTLSIPPSVPPGSWRLSVCADARSRVHESNDRNNCRAAAQRVAVGDVTPPKFGGLVRATTCIPGPVGGTVRSTPYALKWDPASDDVTPQKKIVYDVYQATTSGGEDFSTPTYTTTPGATSFATPALPTDAQFYFVVRARDQAGNSDANKVEREGQNLCD